MIENVIVVFLKFPCAEYPLLYGNSEGHESTNFVPERLL